MNYSIIRFSTSSYSLPNIDDVYKKTKDLSYEDTKEYFFSNLYFEMSDSFSKTMNQIGNNSYDFVSDFEILQKKWADERFIKYHQNNWKVEIILMQINHYKPDIIFFQDYYSLPIKVRKDLKKIFPFIKLIVMHKGYPSSLHQFGDFDHIFAASVDFYNHLKKNDFPASLSYHYFDEQILNKIKTSNKIYDLSFIGTTGFNYPSHSKRFLILSNLLNFTNIHIWANEYKKKTFDIRISKFLIKKILFYILNFRVLKISEFLLSKLNNDTKIYKFVEEVFYKLDNLENKELNKWFFEKLYEINCDYNRNLGKHKNANMHSPVFGINYFQALANSKITLNIHANQSHPYLNAKRLFESTGVGALLVTDSGNNISDLFVDNKEIITFKNYPELREKIFYLQNNPKEVKKISKAGQEKTIKYHNSFNRIKEIDYKLKKLL